MQKFISPVVVASFLEAAGDKIFTVTFEKKDGTVRILNGRRGVKKFVKGTGTNKSKTVFTVYDMQKKDYRSVSLSRVIEARVRGAKLTVAN